MPRPNISGGGVRPFSEGGDRDATGLAGGGPVDRGALERIRANSCCATPAQAIDDGPAGLAKPGHRASGLSRRTDRLQPRRGGRGERDLRQAAAGALRGRRRSDGAHGPPLCRQRALRSERRRDGQTRSRIAARRCRRPSRLRRPERAGALGARALHDRRRRLERARPPMREWPSANSQSSASGANLAFMQTLLATALVHLGQSPTRPGRCAASRLRVQSAEGHLDRLQVSVGDAARVELRHGPRRRRAARCSSSKRQPIARPATTSS